MQNPNRLTIKPCRSRVPPFKGRSGKYNLISHDSPAILAENYKKKQSSSKLVKNLYEREDEEKEQEEAKLPYDTTAVDEWFREVTLQSRMHVTLALYKSATF